MFSCKQVHTSGINIAKKILWWNDFCNNLFKLSAYKMGISMRRFKLPVLSLFKLPLSVSGENRSLNEHLRAKHEQLRPQNKNRSLNKIKKNGAKINPLSVSTEFE